MSTTTQLATRQPQELAPASSPTFDDMLMAAAQSGNPDAVGIVERLATLKADHEKREAEKAFNRAFVKLQREMPEVSANKIIPNKDGSTRSTFASYDEIWNTVKPHLIANGFAVKFDTETKGETRVKVTCRLMHEDGHATETAFEARGGSGAPGTSTAQQDGGTANFAKRYALCLALNIVIDHDADARAVGTPITIEQASALYDRAEAAGMDLNAILDFAHADKFEEIPSVKYAEIDELIRQKERTKQPKRGPSKPEDRDADGNFRF